MKHASSPTPRILKPALVSLLALALTSPTLPREARAAENDVATNTLSGLNNVLGGLNSFQTAFGASNTQLQALVTQLSGAQNAAQGAQAQQSQLDQIAQQLQLAAIGPDGAQACIQKATRTYEKYHKNHTKAGDVAGDKIAGIEPTCSNYGFVLDAISTNDEKISDTNKKMACLVKLQNTIGELANKAKQPVSQLMNSAGEVYKTHSQIIDSHKKIATKLSNDLNGPDGKGGYRAQVQNLRALSLELNNVLNAKKSEKEGGLKNGLVKQVDELQTMRAALGNDWYYTLMADVSYCFNSTPQPCFDNNESMPPSQCVAALTNNNGGKTAGERARARTDSKALMNLARMNSKNAQEKNLPANIDIAKPGEFLGFARKRFEATMASEISAFGNHQFSGKVDKSKIKQAIQQGYDNCWEQAVATFNSDLHSKGSRYYSKITAMKDAERETSNDIKNWIDRIEGDMTQFRTSFHKVYNSELAQFKTDCTADEDPYRSLDCLRVLSATLDSGLKGTRRAIRLGNGTQYTSFAGETVIPMQTLTSDATGKPTIGTTNASCAGFDDCLNYLERSQSEHESAASKGEEDRAKFVDQHNTAVRAAFTQLSSQFGMMSQLMAQGINSINGELAGAGVKGTLKTKDVKGEPLVENEKTGMIDMPKDMKAALAGISNFSEVEDTKEVTEGIHELRKELAKKRSEAMKMKSKCKIEKADYEAFSGLMPKECSETAEICGGTKLSNAGIQMEDLFRRSGVSIEDNARLTASREYNQCRSQASRNSRNVTNADIRRAAKRGEYLDQLYEETTVTIGTGETAKTKTKKERNQDIYDDARDDAIAQKEYDQQDTIRAECNGLIYSSLDGLAKKSRSKTLKDQNSALVQALRDIGDACNKVPKPRPAKRSSDNSGEETETPERYANEDSDVTAACEAYKTAAKAAKPPEGEDETKVDGSSKAEPAKNPFDLPSFTAPAK